MSTDPTGRAAPDRDSTHGTTDDAANADDVTIVEIAEFLRHLRRVCAPGADPAEHDAFLARKADLFARINTPRAAAGRTTPTTPPTSEGGIA